MNPDQELANILRQLAPLPDRERSEALLACFAAAVGEMDTASLRQFRAFCAACDDGTTAERTMLEVIDGQLALRELGIAG